jgi:hypothetical protein
VKVARIAYKARQIARGIWVKVFRSCCGGDRAKRQRHRGAYPFFPGEALILHPIAEHNSKQSTLFYTKQNFFLSNYLYSYDATT